MMDTKYHDGKSPVHFDMLRDDDFEVVRSDQGDGGWSIHWKYDRPDEDGMTDPLTYGPSSYDSENDDWVRPTVEDYASAIDVLVKRYGLM